MLSRILLAFSCFFRILFNRPLPAEVRPEPPLPSPPPPPLPPKPTEGAVPVLALFQRDGRLIDFLLEDIDGYTDEQVGAAVRDVHRGCRKALEEHFVFQPVLRGPEGSQVTVEPGFDAAAIRLTGDVSGEPPFSGTLRHPGWRVAKMELPSVADGIVAPANVEL